jgi:hypothetical protein
MFSGHEVDDVPSRARSIMSRLGFRQIWSNRWFQNTRRAGTGIHSLAVARALSRKGIATRGEIVMRRAIA